jgi:uncharacterized protein YegL
MKKNYTHITVVLDRSGSMNECWNDTIGGLKEIVKSNKEVEGECTFSLVAFDTMVEKPATFLNIQDVDIDSFKLFPRGGTALIDAACIAIDETGRKLAELSDADRPEKVLFIIQTDGYENSSQEFKSENLKERIERQKNDYGWEFMFIGADESAIMEAVKAYGFGKGSTMHYNTSNTGSTFTRLAEKSKNMRMSDKGSMMYAASVSFSKEEREEALKQI